ncbi:MAG: bacterial transcriptional activator domain-containing protein [Chthonomonas sp.]|nr:bacterial transcriptional activator domain-containing protein [Chthonomonas sp.]
MGARVELLGRGRLLSDGREIKSGHFPLLALLALRAPALVSRGEVVELLYPNIERKEALNRLRVGLSRLRDVVPLAEDGDNVGIERQVGLDLLELRQRLSDLRPQSDAEEMCGLRAHLDLLSSQLLPQLEGPWVEREQTAWSLEAVEYLTRLAELAEQESDWGLQKEAADHGLKHLPHDDELWRHALSASSRLGTSAETLQVWNRARRSLQSEGMDFSAPIIAFAQRLLASATQRSGQLGKAEEDVLLRYSESCLKQAPDILLNFLASPAFEAECKREPTGSLRLLEAALGASQAADGSTISCRVARATTLGYMERWPESIAESQALLCKDLDPRDRHRLLNSLSFGCVFAGELKAGLDYLHDLLQLCETHGWDHEKRLAQTTQASCLWMLTHFDEADALFAECIAYFEALEGKDIAARLATTRSNHAGLMADLERYSESVRTAQAAFDASRKIGTLDTTCRAAATLARAAMGLDRTAEGLGFARLALRLAARQSGVRLHVNTLETIGLGLAMGPHPDLGQEMVSQGWKLREEHNLPMVELFLWRRSRVGKGSEKLMPKDSKHALAEAYRALESM